ncbi:ABC transporter ATP-binding protein [Meridianimarinicoccus aquatilis]|uniref:ABC transporter ATP-binding protein n=1 Tax=Meridianimarinicoccus aquatilis TaxID=2552766 RepID=A0A4R6APX0_9RHOB|nr:ABC transporter ATP-binding protein [Fluviibacterium aquatile]TDL85454.1 ABC transporter ATP-binding protein [Fluviibacterium aquatile]
MTQEPILRLDGITKRFGAITANEDVTIALAPGEVLALLGENGAGKTTLMNILFGHYMPDAGTVTVGGQALRLGVPRDAIAAGVGMVHQHFTLAPNLTVLENVMCGTEPLVSFRSGRAAARAKLAGLADRFGLAVDPDAHVSALSVGQQQRVEILKALYNDARILILDEPTAVLTRPEAEHLFATLRDMAQQGLSIIFISHKLHEVMAGADRVVVLRGGRVTAERKTGATSQAELAELMVGRRVERPVRQANPVGPLLIEARKADVPMPGGTPLRSVDFSLRGAEILGIIGVSGNGQTTLAHLLSGLARPSNGEVLILGQDARVLSAAKMAAMGVGRIPEDRNTEGAVGSFPLWQNAVLERLSDVRFSRFGVVRGGAARRFCADIATRFDLRGGGPETETRQLSGGNMQKLILGRNLADAPRILIAAQPTRGLDEGAIAAMHAELLAAAKGGTGVVLISEDLDEVIALADRAQAIVNGRLSPPVAAEDLDAQRLGLMMAGVWEGMADAV